MVAQVQLPTVNLGDTNFEDGFGAPGWFLEEFPGGYIAGELTYKKRGKAKIAVKSSTLQHDVLSIAREASAAPAATFKRDSRKLQ